VKNFTIIDLGQIIFYKSMLKCLQKAMISYDNEFK